MINMSSKLKSNLFLFFLITFFVLILPQSAFAASKCKVTFANEKGIVSNDTFKKMEKTVNAGTYIQLPQIKSSGYRYYWVLKSTTAPKRYLTGTRVKITQNVTFCLNRSRLYNIRFFSANGKYEYTSLKIQLAIGEYLTLPTVPSTSTWKGLGWTNTANSTSGKVAGTKIRVTGNMNFYGVFQRIYTVKLCKNDGTLYGKASIPYGKKVKFPVIDTNNGNMFLGWSQKKGQYSSPQYYSGSYIPNVSATYYMVEYPEKADKAPSTIRTSSKYSTVYFIGDSRTYDTSLAIGSSKPDNVKFICKPGEGLTWFAKYGCPELLNDLIAKPVSTKKAVIFNLGGNDLFNAKLYVNYYSWLSNILKKYNCDLYLMSVNPVNSSMFQNYYNKASYRTEQRIDVFNNELYRSLCIGKDRTFTYINTCYLLRRNGWISNRFGIGQNDGLHYSPNTSLRVYDYCIRIIDR